MKSMRNRSFWMSTLLIVVMLLGTLNFPSDAHSAPVNQGAFELTIPLYNQGYVQSASSISVEGINQAEDPSFQIRKPFEIELDTNEELDANDVEPEEPVYRRFDVRAFFDHDIPRYNLDTNTTTTIFTGDTLTPAGVNRTDQGRNWYGGHPGIDTGTGDNELEILAAADGRIEFVGEQTINCGNELGTRTDLVVTIGHDIDNDQNYDYWTEYRHLGSFGRRLRNSDGQEITEEGDWVQNDIIRSGEVVGIADNSGCSTGSHLHFEVKRAEVQPITSPEQIPQRRQPRPVDPFGWWGENDDPWADTVESVWLWSEGPTPTSVAPGTLAVTDDRDHGFQKFMPLLRRDQWQYVGESPDAINDEFWVSTSIAQDANATPKNWAIWGLHVPADGTTYYVEAFIPSLPINVEGEKTSQADYEIRYINADGTISILDANGIDQTVDNQWVRLHTDALDFIEGETVLVLLSDIVPGQTGRRVVFDAIRLVDAGGESPAPIARDLGNLAIVLDDTTSMNALSKLGAITNELTQLMATLVADNLTFNFTLVPFADFVVVDKVVDTSDPAIVTQWLNSLDPDADEGSNPFCPENSLGAIREANARSSGGDMWLITDDTALDLDTLVPQTLVDLLLNRNRLNAVIYPPTCSSESDAALGFLGFRLASTLTGGTYFRIDPSETERVVNVLLQEARASAQLAYSSGSIESTTTNAAGVAEPESISYVIPLDDTVRKANFLMNVFAGNPELTLVDPDGVVVTDVYTDTQTTIFGLHQYIESDSPVAGEWKATVSGSGQFALSVSSESDVELTRLSPSTATVGRPFLLTAQLDGAPNSVLFELVSSDGLTVIPVELKDDGTGSDFTASDGVFSGRVVLDDYGDYRLRSTGQSLSGQTFVRTDPWPVHVQSLYVVPPENGLENPNTLVPYTFIIGNAGDQAIRVELSAESSARWQINDVPGEQLLEPGQEVSVTVTLAIPPTAVGSDMDELTLAAVQIDSEEGAVQEVVWGTVRTWITHSDIPPTWQEPTALDTDDEPSAPLYHVHMPLIIQ